MWKRSDLKAKAKEALKRNYWKAVLVSLVFIGVFGGVAATTSQESQQIEETMEAMSPALAIAIILLVLVVVAAVIILRAILLNPLEVGVHKFRINAIQDTGNVSDLGIGYDTQYKRNVKTLSIRFLFTFDI